jgi:hypothetical protein
MSNISSIPNGMHTVTPHLVCAGAAEAIEFYKKAFNATETSRLPGPNGRLVHASIRIGDSTVMLVDEMPEHGALGPKSLKGSPSPFTSTSMMSILLPRGPSGLEQRQRCPLLRCFGVTATARSRIRLAIAGRSPLIFGTSRRPTCKKAMQSMCSQQKATQSA